MRLLGLLKLKAAVRRAKIRGLRRAKIRGLRRAKIRRAIRPAARLRMAGLL
jgi:hypothetical protein